MFLFKIGEKESQLCTFFQTEVESFVLELHFCATTHPWSRNCVWSKTHTFQFLRHKLTIWFSGYKTYICAPIVITVKRYIYRCWTLICLIYCSCIQQQDLLPSNLILLIDLMTYGMIYPSLIIFTNHIHTFVFVAVFETNVLQILCARPPDILGDYIIINIYM